MKIISYIVIGFLSLSFAYGNDNNNTEELEPLKKLFDELTIIDRLEKLEKKFDVLIENEISRLQEQITELSENNPSQQAEIDGQQKQIAELSENNISLEDLVFVECKCFGTNNHRRYKIHREVGKTFIEVIAKIEARCKEDTKFFNLRECKKTD